MVFLTIFSTLYIISCFLEGLNVLRWYFCFACFLFLHLCPFAKGFIFFPPTADFHPSTSSTDETVLYHMCVYHM